MYNRLSEFCEKVGIGATPMAAGFEGDLVEIETHEGGRLVLDITTAEAVGLPLDEASAIASFQPSLLSLASAYAEHILVPANAPRWLAGLGGEAYKECPGSRTTVWFGPRGAFALVVPE